jgi:hypothetical protein
MLSSERLAQWRRNDECGPLRIYVRGPLQCSKQKCGIQYYQYTRFILYIQYVGLQATATV